MISNVFFSDVVDTVTFDTEIKFRDETETETLLHQKLRDFKNLCILPKFLLKTPLPLSLNFFQIFGIFPTCFSCFLLENVTKKIVKL